MKKSFQTWLLTSLLTAPCAFSQSPDLNSCYLFLLDSSDTRPFNRLDSMDSWIKDKGSQSMAVSEKVLLYWHLQSLRLQERHDSTAKRIALFSMKKRQLLHSLRRVPTHFDERSQAALSALASIPAGTERIYFLDSLVPHSLEKLDRQTLLSLRLLTHQCEILDRESYPIREELDLVLRDLLS